VAGVPTAGSPGGGPSGWLRRLRVLRGTERFGLVAVACLLILAVVGPVIAPYPTTAANPAATLQPPNATHWFGTDENGMDIFSRIIAAPRVDVSVAFISISIAVIVGTALGVFAGFFEGSSRRFASIVGEAILRLIDVIQAFPVFILAMVLVAVRGASTENIVIAVAFVNMPVFLRIARAEVLSLRERPFAEAAQSIGARDRSIAFRHLLPNAFPPLIAQISATMGFAILLTAGLSFVGAGVSPPTPELGGMISTGAQSMIIGLWWPSLFPGIALGLVVFSFAAGGEALAHLLEPRSTDAEGSTAREEAALVIAAGSGVAAGAVAQAVLGSTPFVGPSGLEEAPGTVETSAAAPGSTGDRSAPTFDHGQTAPADTLLRVTGLTVDFRNAATTNRVIDDVSLWVSPGEALGIVGEAGSGKSVLVRAVLRLLPDDAAIAAGSVRYRGDDLLSMDADHLRGLRAVEFSPILPNAKDQLSPVSRIADLMVLVYRAHARASRRAALVRAVEALRAVGIQDPERRLSAYPHELSGGMAQRVCIAMSLMHSPRLLVADEPTAGLDVTVQRQVLDQLVAAARDRQAAQLIVTRDLGIVAQYCQRVAVMRGGRIVESGPTAEVFRSPRHPYTIQLLQAVGVDIGPAAPPGSTRNLAPARAAE
jgi:ABC-type dipeptide/oligopeptide/nickel transport system ATPase component/ABC-type dipeptide/oligopeptide/nickel transport system permease subunit